MVNDDLAREARDTVGGADAAVYRKVRWHLLPWLFVGYLLCFMDRTIVGIASLEMNASIGLSAAAYGTGAGLFFLTYVLFETPANMVMARVGARIWMARIMITWGLVTVGTAFIQGEISFYVMRLLLGIAEAGFFPGMIFYIALWFPPALRAKPVASLVLAVPIASVLGAPFGGWILGWNGALEGWQWLFVVVGGVTVLFGIALVRLLPSNPAQARWLTQAERETVEKQAGFQRSEHAWRDQARGFVFFLRSPVLWALTLVYFVIAMVAYASTFFLPKVVAEFSGLDNFETGVVVAIPWLLSFVVTYLIARSSERTGKPWAHLVVALVISVAGFATLYASTSALPLFVLSATAVVGLITAYAGPYWSVVTPLLGRPVEAAGAIALVNSLASTGGFFGPHLLGQAIDAAGGRWQGTPPIAAAALFVAALLVVVSWWASRRRRAEGVTS